VEVDTRELLVGHCPAFERPRRLQDEGYGPRQGPKGIPKPVGAARSKGLPEGKESMRLR
jgi:hypothetical protein